MKNKKLFLIILALQLGLTTGACGLFNPPPPPKPKPQEAPGNPAATQSRQTPPATPTVEQPPVQNPAGPQSQPETSLDQAVLKPVGALTPLSGSYLFSEGPAADAQGDIYFSDINAGRIYKWSSDGQVSVFLEGLKGPNGLAFTRDGQLIVCEGGNGRLISVDPQGGITPLVEQYQQVRFNEPNDLWIDPQGGIYFTDPVYQSKLVQDGEHVYYLTPDRSQVVRVIDDLTRPNGIVGTPDGKTLYVADHGAGKTYAYTVQENGMLSGKRLFASLGSDGMELDKSGRLYLTTGSTVQILDATGNPVQQIQIPAGQPTNLAFGGTDGKTLFITAREAVYTLQMGESEAVSSSGTFALSSPDIAADGRLPVEYTCDGASSSLALNWSGAPAGTVSFAVIMHHVASPEDIHWYWVLYNIPADVTGLAKNSSGVGTLGTNSVNDRMEYAPPCSKGPGDKTYTYTVYALSAQPQFSVPPAQVTRQVMLDAIKDITIASAEFSVVYARQ